MKVRPTPKRARISEGVIVKLSEKGFGFIKSKSGKELYFHMTSVFGRWRFDSLGEGQRVSYKRVKTDKGHVAEGVKGLEEPPERKTRRFGDRDSRRGQGRRRQDGGRDGRRSGGRRDGDSRGRRGASSRDGDGDSRGRRGSSSRDGGNRRRGGGSSQNRRHSGGSRRSRG